MELHQATKKHHQHKVAETAVQSMIRMRETREYRYAMQKSQKDSEMSKFKFV